MSEEPIDLDLSEDFLDSLNRSSKDWLDNTQEIRDTINYFLAKDQDYRKVFVDSIKAYFDEESEEYKSYWQLVEKNDSIVQVEFLEYIKANGYPGNHRCGTGLATVILQHINDELLDDFDTVLLEEIKKGNIYPYYYGSMMDRANCRLNGKAFYNADRVTESCTPSNEQILKNRVSAGLSPFFQGPRKFVKISSSKLLEFY